MDRIHSLREGRRIGLDPVLAAFHFLAMDRRTPPTLNMLPDGRFRHVAGPPLSFHILVGAVLLALVAGGLALAALAVSVAAVLVPVALLAAVVAWAMVQWRRWLTTLRRGPDRDRGALSR